MLFLVVGTPWKTPRSSRLCCPDFGDGWFGGTSSTRTATLRMRLRNSCGSESSTSSTTSAKCSRFILHPRARSLRVVVAVYVEKNAHDEYYDDECHHRFSLKLVGALPRPLPRN